MQLCRRTEKPPSILEGGSHLLRFLRGIVLRGIVLRGIVLRGIVLRGIVLRGIVLRGYHKACLFAIIIFK